MGSFDLRLGELPCSSLSSLLFVYFVTIRTLRAHTDLVPPPWFIPTVIQVTENGMAGSIMTFYEITDGDMAHTTGKPPSPLGLPRHLPRHLTPDPCPFSTHPNPTRPPVLLPLVARTEFHQLPPVLLRRSLETLVKRGKAQIVKGEAEGVKFF